MVNARDIATIPARRTSRSFSFRISLRAAVRPAQHDDATPTARPVASPSQHVVRVDTSNESFTSDTRVTLNIFERPFSRRGKRSEKRRNVKAANEDVRYRRAAIMLRHVNVNR